MAAMKSFRTVLFWTHLTCGAAAGVVILVMSVTGVALTYEKQMLEWADRRAWTAPSSTGARHLPPETLLAKVAEAQPGAAPIGLTLRADAAAPATVILDGNKTLLVDPYAGTIIGEPPAGLRTFFRTMTVWHRYVALEGTSRATGKAITGAANFIFLFIVLSGMYLWLPRVWTWIQFKNVLWFRGGLAPKARDFNWHNVIGIWSAIPLAIVVVGAMPISYPWASNLVFLFIVLSGLYLWLPRVWTWIQFKNVLWFRGGLAPKARDFNWHNVIGVWSAVPLAIVVAGALPISYPWASNLVYRIAGDTPPAPPAAAVPARAAQERVVVNYVSGGVDGAWSAAQSQIPSWRTMTTRLATTPTAPVVITVDEGYGGQPQKRTTFTITRATGMVAKAEDFQSLSAGRRARSWLRFAHTGEIYGLTGQTIAGIASAGGAFLVYTGIALALRRLSSWLSRRRAASIVDTPKAA